MKRIILIFSVTLVFLMLSCYQPAFGIPFKGDHKTESIRNNWMICFRSLQERDPRAFPPKQWELCDCYIDSLRREIPHEDFKKLEGKEKYELSFTIMTQCLHETGYADLPKPI